LNLLINFIHFANLNALILKKLIFLCTLFLYGLASCKKNNSGSPSYYLTANIDGKSQTCNVNTLATRVTQNGHSAISIQGFSDNTPNSSSFILDWDNLNSGTATFTTGTYYDTSGTYSTDGVYVLAPGDEYFAGTQVMALAASLGTPIAHFTITITALDSTSVKGTFSGDFYQQISVPGGPEKSIANGEFYVPWKK
jgi:hypothetical protein